MELDPSQNAPTEQIILHYNPLWSLLTKSVKKTNIHVLVKRTREVLTGQMWDHLVLGKGGVLFPVCA